MANLQSILPALLALLIASTAGRPAAGQARPPQPPAAGLVARWTFDGPGPQATFEGGAQTAKGVVGRAFLGDGRAAYVRAPDRPAFDFSDATFSVAAWINVYMLGRGQQMIVAKNRYALNEREWGLMVDRDSRVRLYLRQQNWKTVAAKTVPTPGEWLHVAATVDRGKATVYINGRQEGQAQFGPALPRTPAPLTIAGVDNNGHLMQLFFGAIDDVCLYSRALAAEEVRGMFFAVTDKHPVPKVERYRLWANDDPPSEQDVPFVAGVRFVVVHRRNRKKDGFGWLHGAAAAWHKGVLYVNWGNNPGAENTPTEVNRGRRSRDGGRTWSEAEMVGPGFDGPECHSHASYLSRQGTLWTFLARFGKGKGQFRGLCTEAFVLDEKTDKWDSRGIVARGIWPLQEPHRMTNGSWLVPGCDEHWRAAVGISRGDDLTHWDAVKVPLPDHRLYTEAAAWFDGPEVILIMRNHSPINPTRNCAAVAVSRDYGRTWPVVQESDFPMVTSKPVAGRLSTGQRYLVCNSSSRSPGSRHTLTVSVTRPGHKQLCRMWRIRGARRTEAGETRDRASAYPYAVEHEGSLYVVYSVDKADCEMAIIPVASLAVD